METGFALPVSFKLIVQSTLPRPSWEERMRRISNSNGFKKQEALVAVQTVCH
jgi:hypothetical protein